MTFKIAVVTDPVVTHHNIEEIIAGGCARWKDENEVCNVHRKSCWHLEHSYGRGKETPASVLLVRNLQACTLHGTCELFEVMRQQARKTLGAQVRLRAHPVGHRASHIPDMGGLAQHTHRRHLAAQHG